MTWIMALLTLAVVIVVHELGHFLVAKGCGVAVLEFAVGFGKKLLAFRRGETLYALRAIPLGGFVRMAGDDPYQVYGQDVEQDRKVNEASTGGVSSKENEEKTKLSDNAASEVADQSLEMLNIPKDRWFLSKGYFSKVAVVFAGPLANILFAIFLSFLLIVSYGVRDGGSPETVPAIIGDLIPGYPAEAAGLKIDDRIVAVGDKRVESWKEMAETVAQSRGDELILMVERPKVAVGETPPLPSGGLDLVPKESEEPAAIVPGRPEAFIDSPYETVVFTLRAKADDPELAVLEGKSRQELGFKIGIAPRFDRRRVSLGEATYFSVMHTVGIGVMTVRGVIGLISGMISHKHIGSPIMIMKEASRSAGKGFESLLEFTIFLSISLGILNLLPIPILDGGHLVFFTIEALKGSPINLRVQQVAGQVGMLVLAALMLLAVSNDLRRMLGFG